MRTGAIGFLALALLPLAGCVLNSAHQVNAKKPAKPGSDGYVIFGLRGPQAPGQPQSIQFDQMSPTTHKLSGNCFFYTRLEATAASLNPGEARFFLFAAPAGDYILSPFIAGGLEAKRAYSVPAGQTVFFGVFSRLAPAAARMAVGMPSFEREDDFKSAEAFAASKGLRVTPAAAHDEPGQPAPFLCTP